MTDSRTRILHALQDHGPQTAAQLADRTGVSLSQTYACLVKLGTQVSRSADRRRIWSAVTPRVKTLDDWMMRR